ncbi:MAG: penicillin-binding protein activator, partial [Gammaproteobacteria bacterium]|nr:penicillin-binding protein activator [Gammaproteobacteria bacterium]
MTNYSLIRLIVLLGAIALLHACVTPTGKLPAQREASVEAAEQAEQKGEYIVAAREYAELTKTAPASKKTSFQLRYAEVLIRAGQIEDAKRALKEITIPRNDRSSQAHLYMVNALLASFEGSYKNAIRLLDKAVSIKNIDPILRTRIYLVMTETELALNNPIGAARNLIVREKYLVDPESIDRNQLKLWEILSAMKPSELSQALNLTRDAKLRGWLELAIANSKGRKELSKTIKSWPQTHPTHPATKTTLATLAGARFKKIGYVSRAALLL